MVLALAGPRREDRRRLRRQRRSSTPGALPVRRRRQAGHRERHAGLRRRDHPGLPDRARHGLELQRRGVRVLLLQLRLQQSRYRATGSRSRTTRACTRATPRASRTRHLPTFYRKRVISSDSGREPLHPAGRARGAVHELLPGLDQHGPSLFLPRAAVAQTGRQVGDRVEGHGTPTRPGSWSASIGHPAEHRRPPCDLPVVGESSNASFSPDGQFVAWGDDEGVKVAGAPNLAAGTETCTLTSPVRVLSATGNSPDFGGADVAGILGEGTGLGPAPGPGGLADRQGQGQADLQDIPAGQARHRGERGRRRARGRIGVPGAGRSRSASGSGRSRRTQFGRSPRARVASRPPRPSSSGEVTRPPPGRGK